MKEQDYKFVREIFEACQKRYEACLNKDSSLVIEEPSDEGYSIYGFRLIKSIKSANIIASPDYRGGRSWSRTSGKLVLKFDSTNYNIKVNNWIDISKFTGEGIDKIVDKILKIMYDIEEASNNQIEMEQSKKFKEKLGKQLILKSLGEYSEGIDSDNYGKNIYVEDVTLFKNSCSENINVSVKNMAVAPERLEAFITMLREYNKK